MLIMFKGQLHRVQGEVNRKGVPHVVARNVATQSDVTLTREIAALGAVAATRHFEMNAQREANALLKRVMS